MSKIQDLYSLFQVVSSEIALQQDYVNKTSLFTSSRYVFFTLCPTFYYTDQYNTHVRTNQAYLHLTEYIIRVS